MNMNPLKSVLRFLGISRPAPKTRLGLNLRRAERLLSFLAIFYLASQAFPQVLFAHVITTNGITLYSRTPLPPEASACVARAAELVRHSELTTPNRAEKIFVCDSPWLFDFFSPRSHGTFGFSMPLTDHVYIASADYAHDLARSTAPKYNVRSLSAVIAHEITHGLIRHRLGWLRSITLQAWVAEGYCDYAVQESSFPEAEGLRLLANGQSDPSISFKYFEYRQMVIELMDNEHLNFAQLVSRANDFTLVETKTRQALQHQTR
jgi:hypothetical protein